MIWWSFSAQFAPTHNIALEAKQIRQKSGSFVIKLKRRISTFVVESVFAFSSSIATSFTVIAFSVFSVTEYFH